MSEEITIPVTPEVAEFFANVLKATRQGLLDWKVETPSKLLTSLDNDYHVSLKLVRDLEGVEDGSPDHVLTLFKGDQKIFGLDRRMISGEEISEALGEPVEYSYPLFDELWRRAYLKGSKISEHLGVLNKSLESRISSSVNPK